MISFHLGEVVIGEFASLLFASPFDFLPFPFQNIFIHVGPPFFSPSGLQTFNTWEQGKERMVPHRPL